jgi:hypothetical protein
MQGSDREQNIQFGVAPASLMGDQVAAQSGGYFAWQVCACVL